MNGRVAALVLALLVPALATVSAADKTPPAPGPKRVAVLDTGGFWRMHNQLKPPVIQRDDGIGALAFHEAWVDAATAGAPGGWTAADFADGNWVRAVALRSAHTPFLARLCLRGKFQVTDPGLVKDLQFKLVYHGGAIVYLNGTEIARKDLPPAGSKPGAAGDGAAGEETLAAPYPVEAFLNAAGGLLFARNDRTPEDMKRFALRERTLEVAIPAGSLRKGTNVLAVEIVRAPYHKVQETVMLPNRDGKPTVSLLWYACEMRGVQLTAAGADGLVPCAARPVGLQVWNSDLMMSDFDLDFGDPSEPLRPVKIVAARNGAFSGKVVVSSTNPLRGLKATAGDLAGGGGAVIPASAVRIRFALPWGDEHLINQYSAQLPPYPRTAGILGALAEKAPEEFPLCTAPARRTVYPYALPLAEPVLGAVAPVWITVAVPAGAAPGAYAGTVKIEVEGEKPVAVPVELKVVDWALPATQDYRTWVELVESPDTLAQEYGLELWSARHWQMIDHAFGIIGQAGARMVHVPLITQTNLGHEQSMVRWIPKGEGKYDYDFTVLDRYLDSAQKNMGTPKIVVFWVWDVYLLKKQIDLEDKQQTIKLLVELGYIQGEGKILKQVNYDPNFIAPDALQKAIQQAGKMLTARKEFLNKGPMVTVVDPDGKTRDLHLPAYDDPSSKALWAPLIAKIQERMKARGIEKAMMFGMSTDSRPSKEEVAFFHDLAPSVPWASQAHMGINPGQLLQDIAPVAYSAKVWLLQFSADKSLYGWKRPGLVTYYDRDRDITPHAATLWTHLAEMSITGDQRGTGRLGADYWPVFKDKMGVRIGFVWTRYPQSGWRNLDLHSHCLAPTADGPVATARFEYFREGVQHCEARIFLEAALTDKLRREKLGEDLATRCQGALDERQTAMVRSMAHLLMDDPKNSSAGSWRGGSGLPGLIWFIGSGWQERSEKLYSLAGEAARKLAEK